MKEPSIRKARIEDLEILLTFEQGIIAFERPFDATLNEDPISYYDIKAMILSNNVELVVAVINNEIVGSGYARIEKPKPYLKHDTFAYLGFMYVIPRNRGRGVNKLIVDALRDWSKSKGINEIRLDVYAENQVAIKAYKKAGFSSHLLNMRLGL